MVFKKLLKIQQCKQASRNSYKTLAKRLFQLYSISGVAIESITKELQWLEYLKISIGPLYAFVHICEDVHSLLAYILLLWEYGEDTYVATWIVRL